MYSAILNQWGISVILYLQTFPLLGEKWIDTFWTLLTKFGDPKMTFVIYMPFIYPFSKHTAQEFMIAGAISEYLNMVFKWILMSDRPYWWIQESGVYTENNMPNLLQFEHTCETGPGSPSGHAMVTSCVWLVFLINIKSRFSMWFVYIAVVFFISLSRLYIAAHFPHQLILGVIIGVSIALLVVKSCRTINLNECVSLAICLFALSSAVLFGAKFFGADLHYTVGLAKRWCAQPHWIHVSTHPFTGMFRDLGAVLGLGVAVWYRNEAKLSHQHLSMPVKLVWAGANLVISILALNIAYNMESVYSFYTFTFIQHFGLVVLIVYTIPLSIRQYKLV